MRILAVDPGYDRLGLAVVESRAGAPPSLLYSSCITTEKSAPFPDRLEHLCADVEKFIGTFSPNAFALELLYFNKNQKTAMRVAEVRGALIALAKSRGLSVHEYTPPQVKISVTGYGKSDKKAVAAMVQRLLPLKKGPRLDDEYDAIAVALTCAARERSPLSTGKS